MFFFLFFLLGDWGVNLPRKFQIVRVEPTKNMGFEGELLPFWLILGWLVQRLKSQFLWAELVGSNPDTF